MKLPLTTAEAKLCTLNRVLEETLEVLNKTTMPKDLTAAKKLYDMHHLCAQLKEQIVKDIEDEEHRY